VDLANISRRLSKNACTNCPNQTSCDILNSTLEWVVGCSHPVKSNPEKQRDEIRIQEIRRFLVPEKEVGERCKFASLAHSEVIGIQDSVVEIFHRQQSGASS